MHAQIIKWSHVHCIFQQFIAPRLVSELWKLALWELNKKKKKQTLSVSHYSFCCLWNFKKFFYLGELIGLLAITSKSHLFLGGLNFPSGESQTYLGGWSGLHCDVGPAAPEDAETFKQGFLFVIPACLRDGIKAPACLATPGPHKECVNPRRASLAC